MKQFRPQLLINEIKIQFIKDYEHYMIVKLGNNQNTISKSLGFVRSALNKAIQAGIIEENPFKNYPLKSIKGNREFLTLSELKKLDKLYYSNTLTGNKKNVLKYFLFCCYTGLRYKDVKTIKHKNINEDIISIEMHKTKEIVGIPLLPQAKKLIELGFKEQYIFKVYADQPTNRYLKDIMKVAEIKKKISFHCARHTFATQGLNFGMPIEVISKLLGHTDLRTTQIYTRITDEYKIKELKKWKT